MDIGISSETVFSAVIATVALAMSYHLVLRQCTTWTDVKGKVMMCRYGKAALAHGDVDGGGATGDLLTTIPRFVVDMVFSV